MGQSGHGLYEPDLSKECFQSHKVSDTDPVRPQLLHLVPGTTRDHLQYDY